MPGDHLPSRFHPEQINIYKIIGQSHEHSVPIYPLPNPPPKLASLVFRGGSHLARGDVLLTKMASL